MKHEDERRLLLDIPLNLCDKGCKIIVAKKDTELGKHYHKKKTERFYLVRGSASLFKESKNNSSYTDMEAGVEYKVKPNEKHTFKLKKGSVLACIVNKKYNPKDDYT